MITFCLFDNAVITLLYMLRGYVKKMYVCLNIKAYAFWGML